MRGRGERQQLKPSEGRGETEHVCAHTRQLNTITCTSTYVHTPEQHFRMDPPLPRPPLMQNGL
jgi:hypothetical protein